MRPAECGTLICFSSRAHSNNIMESTLEKRLVSSWFDVHSSVPQSYVQPPECRPGTLILASANTKIPVIDLGAHDRPHTTKQILKASQDYGFFQVINHGVPKDLMDEALNIFKEFHAMGPKEKVNESSRDPNGSCKLYTSGENYKKETLHFWKDTLSQTCPPSEENIEYWPQKPYKYREVVGKYAREVRKLGLKILEMLCEGLGLTPGYFSGLCENPKILAHHYPPCPDPNLTLGVAKHRDPSIITILLQEEHVHALQVLKDEEWIAIEPIPGAFVVNIGLLMQMISNGRLIGALHRAVTNSSIARTSVAYFIYPSPETVIEPAQDLLNATTPPIYRSISFAEFHRIFFTKGPNNIEQEFKS